ncbi:MAG: hypothetical protein NVSMB5_25060 [Candidatus Velthaea sp.]
MISYDTSPRKACQAVGARARELRLSIGRTQADIAKAAGLSVPTITRFERTGQVSFEAVVRIAFALRAENGFDALFPPVETRSVDDILKAQHKPQRARPKR